MFLKLEIINNVDKKYKLQGNHANKSFKAFQMHKNIVLALF